VVSYNPGYENILKDMKPSTRQRMVVIELDFPSGERELEILEKETRLTGQAAADLIRLAQAVRRVQQTGLREVASTRTLVAAAGLIQERLGFAEAATAAIAGPLSDDPELRDGLVGMISTGITERTLFRHVPSKAALFRDAVISRVEAFVAGFGKAWADRSRGGHAARRSRSASSSRTSWRCSKANSTWCRR